MLIPARYLTGLLLLSAITVAAIRPAHANIGEAYGFGARNAALGGATVDEQPLSLEDALIAYVVRQGDTGFFLNAPGGAK